MDQFTKQFIQSQDSQFEKVTQILHEAEEFIAKYGQEMSALESARSQEVTEWKAKLQEIAEKLCEVYSKVDEYETIVTRAEQRVNRAEQDLEAIEEYAYGRKPIQYLGNIVSSLSKFVPYKR